jgi:hypothetical protein
MITTRYTGEDIPVDLEFETDDHTPIDPTSLLAIIIYLVGDKDVVLNKYKEPETEGYDTLEVTSTYVRLYMQSDLTKTLANKKMKLQVNLQESAPDLNDGFQNTIIVSEEFQIKQVAIGAESLPIEEES